MKRTVMIIASAALACFFSASLAAEEGSGGMSGEILFMQHCAGCHPDGGNIMNPSKTLSKEDREANDIKTARDIVNKMRNPGPVPTHPSKWSGMTMFDEKTISDKDAYKIAEYILETFK